jgi:hypothetical protein
VALLYVLMHERWHQRTLLSALGVKDVDQVDDLLEDAARAYAARSAAADAGRHVAVSQFVAAAARAGM